MGIVFLKLCVVWVCLLHNLKLKPSLQSFVQSAPWPGFSPSPTVISYPTYSYPICLAVEPLRAQIYGSNTQSKVSRGNQPYFDKNLKSMF